MFCRLRKCALSRIYQNIDSDSLGILFISFFVQCAEGVAGYILGGKSLHNCLYLTVHEMMINLEPTLQCCIQCAASCVWGGAAIFIIISRYLLPTHSWRILPISCFKPRISWHSQKLRTVSNLGLHVFIQCMFCNVCKDNYNRYTYSVSY
jgi:hypothetical protein